MIIDVNNVIFTSLGVKSEVLKVQWIANVIQKEQKSNVWKLHGGED